MCVRLQPVFISFSLGIPPPVSPLEIVKVASFGLDNITAPGSWVGIR